ncbi:hypothetical protein L873DRAFT_167279 [Choiromyces venosus 120613-1]|uniref:Uncharacterized protein n=1 Tax=Choiromyces venosus 120613-1 TaxID=1336337 RepID=A0A3N4K4Z2_9PEZI|nr:hypothetical protein L873DRAFT_167279 [Choiromyces venosus 120613-1]
MLSLLWSLCCPNKKWSLPSSHHHSPAHNCLSLFFFCPHTIIVPFLSSFPPDMIEPKHSTDLNRHFICKYVVFPILFCLSTPSFCTIGL